MGDDARFGDLADDAKGDHGRRMGMDDSTQVGALSINGPMEGVLGGGSVRTDDRTVSLHAHDVIGRQLSLVHPGGRDPDIAVGILDRQVAARQSGHAVAVDAIHNRDQLVTRM